MPARRSLPASHASAHRLEAPPQSEALETLTALAEGRVEHLILDVDGDFSAVADMVPAGIGGPAELLGERAVEAAVATGAEVTALAAEDSKALAEAGGIAALLRY